MADTPPAEVDITADLVTALLVEQHPDLAGLPLRFVGNGWDNAMWRLGPDLAVRLPRRQIAAQLALNEQRWLPELARRLPVPIPAAVRVGEPGLGYPWHWSVVPWFAGHRAAARLGPAAGRLGSAAGALGEGLAAFFTALHVPAPPDAPSNPYRGVPLSTRADVVRERLAGDELAHVLHEHLPDVPHAAERLVSTWESAMAVPQWTGPPVWLHGDPHPGNLLLDDDGGLAAVLDFGDICSGDPATDLAVAWMLFDIPTRAGFVSRVTAASDWDSAVWERARGWALSFGSLFALHGDDPPDFLPLGIHTLRQALET